MVARIPVLRHAVWPRRSTSYPPRAAATLSAHVLYADKSGGELARGRSLPTVCLLEREKQDRVCSSSKQLPEVVHGPSFALTSRSNSGISTLASGLPQPVTGFQPRDAA